MNGLFTTFGAAIFTTENVAPFVTAMTGAISENIGAVILLAGTIFGINFARKMINRGLSGRV